jgi:Family of unknown function (DUF6519)
MKADLTRQTFRPERHYAATVQQQGRVPMDADWNEQVDIQQHHDEVETIDVVGQTGVPNGDSFKVEALTGDLQLHPGRAYVDGILCELDAGIVPVTAITGSGTIVPLTWTIDGLQLRLGEWVQISSMPSDAKSYRITAMDLASLTLTLGVGSDNLQTLFAGKTTSIRRVVSYVVQPEWWKPDFTSYPTTAVPIFNGPSGKYLAYLDVWRRHVTALEDSNIREIALGGPDTCTRERTTWQLKLKSVADTDTCDSAALPTNTSTGMLSARALLPGDDTACILAPTARYRSLENQLYRVEVHDPGILGSSATFKYSKDNGTVVTPWIKQDGNNLYVGSTGKDSVLGFATGDWVEIIDDWHELNGQTGLFALVADVQTDYITVSTTIPASTTITFTDYPLNPRIRKWDAAPASVAQSATDGFLTLGTDGVQIKFEAGYYNTGDYWLVPARTISTDVEWPKSELGTPLPRPPLGIQHHYLKLALATWNGTTFTVQDCRNDFPPLTDIHAKDVWMDPGPCNFPANVKTVQDAITELCREKAGCCAVTIMVGDDVQEVVDAALAKNLAADIRGIEICFCAGTHRLRDTLVITAPAGGGDITISGSGPTSKVIAPTVPTAIRLVGWTTATVKDVTLVGGTARVTRPPAERAIPTEVLGDRRIDAAPAETSPPTARTATGPSGTLVFFNCLVAVAERMWSVCPPSARRVTSCITASCLPLIGQRASVRVTNCELIVGNHQVGVLVQSILRSTIEGNRIQVLELTPAERTALFASRDYQGMLRHRLMSYQRIGTAASYTVATKTDEARVHYTLNNVRMAWTADSAAAPLWSSYLAGGAPPRYFDKATLHEAVPVSTSDTSGHIHNPVHNPTAARVAMAMHRLATDIVRKVSRMTEAEATAARLGGFYTWVQAQHALLDKQMFVAIGIGGSVAGDVRIHDNQITGAIDGIVAALQAPAGATREIRLQQPRITRARIAANTIDLEGPRRIASAGIAVSSCASCIIEDNWIRHQGDAPSVGIFVSGTLGRMMRTNGNHILNAQVGILVRPRVAASGNELWILNQNVSFSTPTPITAPPAVLRVNNAP